MPIIKNLERLVKREAVRQVQAPKYKFDGKIPSLYQNDRWFADLIDFSSTPSDNGKRNGLRRTKDGESYILVVQDVFSRFLWTEALVNKTPQAVAKAFEEILARAGTKQRSLTSDLGPEFEGPFKQMLEANGIEAFQKRKEDINAIATIDTAIGNLKKALVRVTRKAATNDWASKLQQVTRGQNNSPMEDYLEGQAPASVSTNEDLINLLEEKNAKYAKFNRQRAEKRAKVLEETGQFRPMVGTTGVKTRGFKPRFGEVKQVKAVDGAEVLDSADKDYLTKFVQPVSETTNDAGPVRIEQGGSELIDATRRQRLEPFAQELVRFLQSKGGEVTTATASKHLRQNPAFQIAMRNVPTFGAFIKLFNSFELIASNTSGGSSKVRLTDNAPRRRRLRSKQPQQNM